MLLGSCRKRTAPHRGEVVFAGAVKKERRRKERRKEKENLFIT
jgi:hypothetical protein